MFFKKYRNSFLFGLLAGFAFAPFYLIIFLPFSFYYIINKITELNNNLEDKKFIKSFLYGLSFGFGYYLIQLYWISFSLFVDIKAYFWLFPFAICLIPFACALYFSCSTLLLFYLIKKTKITNKFIISIFFSIFYLIFEYLRGLIFPWNLFSYTVGFSDILIQPLFYFNIYIFDFILISFFSFGYVLFEYKNKKIILIKDNIYYSIYYIFLLFFIILFGVIRLNNAKTKEFDLNFRLVQANIPQNVKWNREEIENNINKHINLTKSTGYENIDIIIWAESSIPYVITENSLLTNIVDLDNKILISGALRGTLENRQLSELWNSIFIFKNGNKINYYDKSILVPFGEYIPFSKYIPFITKITNGNIDLSKGYGNKTIEISNIKISPLVCYEIIFPNDVIDKKNRPDLIINLTNDGWFGISSGPYQHFISAKFRAVENKIPIIRVSNSGISAYIDEYGRVIKKIKLGTAGFIDM